MRSWRAPLTPIEVRRLPVAFFVVMAVWMAALVVILIEAFR